MWRYGCEVKDMLFVNIGEHALKHLLCLLLASLLTIPPWGIYRSKPLKWVEARNENDVSDGKSKKKK